MVRLCVGSLVEIGRRKQGILLNHHALLHFDEGESDDAKACPEKNFKKNALNHRFVVASMSQDWYSG